MCLNPRIIAATGILIAITSICIGKTYLIKATIIVAISYIIAAIAIILLGNSETVTEITLLTILCTSSYFTLNKKATIAIALVYITLSILEKSLNLKTSRPIEASTLIYLSLVIAKYAPEAIVIIISLITYSYFSNTIRSELEENTNKVKEAHDIIDIIAKLSSLIKLVKTIK